MQHLLLSPQHKQQRNRFYAVPYVFGSKSLAVKNMAQTTGIQGFGYCSLYFIVEIGIVTIRLKLIVIPSEDKDEKEKNENYIRKKFFYQSFQRSFTVPQNDVDSDKFYSLFHGKLSFRIALQRFKTIID